MDQARIHEGGVFKGGSKKVGYLVKKKLREGLYED